MTTITYKAHTSPLSASKGAPMRKKTIRVERALSTANDMRKVFTTELEEPRLNKVKNSLFAGQGKALRDVGKNGSAPTVIINPDAIITDNSVLKQLLSEIGKLSARKHFDVKGVMIPSSLERMRAIKRQVKSLIRSNKKFSLLQTVDYYVKSVMAQKPCIASVQTLLTMRG